VEEADDSAEKQQLEALSVPYLRIPISVWLNELFIHQPNTQPLLQPPALNDKTAAEVFEKIAALPSPSLIHCKSMMRAAFITILQQYSTDGKSHTLDELRGQLKTMGLDLDAVPPLRAFAEAHLKAHAK